MKKLSLFVLAALLVFGITQARAEQSPQTTSGRSYLDNQVFTTMYNNSSADVTANSVVILDITGTAGTTLGSYFTTTATAGSQYVIGVADEKIVSGGSGRICRRGPHIVNFTSIPTVGQIVSAGATAGKATSQATAVNGNGYLGVAIGDNGTGSNNWWVWVSPTCE